MNATDKKVLSKLIFCWYLQLKAFGVTVHNVMQKHVFLKSNVNENKKMKIIMKLPFKSYNDYLSTKSLVMLFEVFFFYYVQAIFSTNWVMNSVLFYVLQTVHAIGVIFTWHPIAMR